MDGRYYSTCALHILRILPGKCLSGGLLDLLCGILPVIRGSCQQASHRPVWARELYSVYSVYSVLSI